MLARMSGNYATIIGHSPNDNKTRIRLPSNAKKPDSGSARATVGIVAGGGHIGKPLLKASHAYHKSKVNDFLDVSAATSHSSSCLPLPSSPEGSSIFFIEPSMLRRSQDIFDLVASSMRLIHLKQLFHQHLPNIPMIELLNSPNSVNCVTTSLNWQHQ